MPKQFYLFILMIAVTSCISITQEKEGAIYDELTNIDFKKEKIDFGEILADKSVSTIFEFSNTGESSLLIKEVTTSCGCTVPEWPKGIIKPHESGEIKIVYDAKYPGRFNKTITVVYNGRKSPQQLIIKGEVAYPEEEKKPASNKTN